MICCSEIKAVIFDMDNTLFDFVEAQLHACDVVAQELHGNKYDLYNYFVRDPTKFEAYSNIADYMFDRKLYDEKKYAELCALYDKIKMDSIVPYQGISEVLRKLKEKGVKLAIATNSPYCNAIARLKKANLIHYFDTIISSCMTKRMKPDPGSISLALASLEVKPAEAIMVGDSLDRDIMAAKALGMFAVYAAYGDKNQKGEYDDVRANIVLNDILDLLKLFDEPLIMQNT